MRVRLPQRGAIISRQPHESSGRARPQDTAAANSEAVWVVPNHAIVLGSATAARVDGPAVAQLLEPQAHVPLLRWPVEILSPGRRDQVRFMRSERGPVYVDCLAGSAPPSTERLILRILHKTRSNRRTRTGSFLANAQGGAKMRVSKT